MVITLASMMKTCLGFVDLDLIDKVTAELNRSNLRVCGGGHLKYTEIQWSSQNAEKVTLIKSRLLDQTVILFNCDPFHNGNFSYRKEFAPRGSKFFPLRAVPYGMENHFYHIR